LRNCLISRLGLVSVRKNPSLAHVFHQVEAIARGLTQVEDQRQKAISGQKLVSLTTSSLAIVAMHVLAIIPIYVNKLEPAVVDDYPNYIWVYVHSLCVYPSFFIVMVVLFVTKNQQLRSSLYRNVSSEISRWAKFKI
jgi:hypothetical protein